MFAPQDPKPWRDLERQAWLSLAQASIGLGLAAVLVLALGGAR